MSDDETDSMSNPSDEEDEAYDGACAALFVFWSHCAFAVVIYLIYLSLAVT